MYCVWSCVILLYAQNVRLGFKMHKNVSEAQISLSTNYGDLRLVIALIKHTGGDHDVTILNSVTNIDGSYLNLKCNTQGHKCNLAI